jgi:uncharacterized protein (TIGR02611 family)
MRPFWFGLAHFGAMEGERRPRPKLIQKLEAQRETHRERNRVFRIAFGVAGLLVLLGGVVMLVTPGPAFVLIPIGLAMLSMEFVWAERLLERSLEQAQIAQEKAAQTTRTQRIMGAVAALLAIAACVLTVLWWDIPLLPDG